MKGLRRMRVMGRERAWLELENFDSTMSLMALLLKLKILKWHELLDIERKISMRNAGITS